LDFTTLKYLVFLGGVALIYRLTPGRFRAFLLLLVSYGFYWTWSGKMALLMFGATAIAYAAGRAIGAAPSAASKRPVALAAVIALVGTLAFFKTEPFWEALTRHSILVPLGISYYTFKLISYVVDVYWEKRSAEKAFIPFAAYVAFFPQIVAGPIQRSESFLEQIQRAPAASGLFVLTGVQRILLGLFKKMVVADNLALLVNFVYSHVYAHGTPLVLGFYLYPLQLYADFSGLTDIAVGSALLLGIESPENFMAPFAAKSISQYWRRWHITLTGWLTDYVFTPLNTATRDFGKAGLVFSLMVNMVLIGIWHQIRWQFAVFGIIHAFYLSVDALSARSRRRFYKSHPTADRVTDWLGPVVTFHLVAIGAVFFRGQSVGEGFFLLGHMAAGIAALSAPFAQFLELSGRNILVGCAGYILIEIADYLRRNGQKAWTLIALPRWVRWSIYSSTAVLLIFTILILAAQTQHRTAFAYAIF
jgi:alginate O-acetyltransferase complex protein AlgI